MDYSDLILRKEELANDLKSLKLFKLNNKLSIVEQKQIEIHIIKVEAKIEILKEIISTWNSH